VALKAIIVGGGIGGLTTAIALRRAGVEAVVFERAPELREIGAGISLWANAMKVLVRLGLYDAVLAAGRPLRPKGQLRSPGGDVFYEIPAVAMEERFGAVTVVVHRADLQKVLLGALDAGALRLGAEVVGLEQDDAGVIARFADGQEERVDFLIGADGLRSAVRARILGDGEPRYAGYVAWRGVARLADDPLVSLAAAETWGRGERFGMAKLGQGRVYWYATRNAPEEVEDVPERRKEELLARFGGWHEPIPALIGATKESDIHRDGIYDREPVKHWGRGRATLLGDAAHPMTPDLGQGACQAIEDAIVLSGCLEEVGDLEAALKLYEARRVGRVAYVVRRSRRLGRVGQLENPLACRLRDAAIKAIPRRARVDMQLGQLQPIVGYDV
jgi:2-polyprenyl-6-methoxyphenol hydroxylase-like FAD-dependent oxidoreductase